MRSFRAFTIIELLVVISIIALLIALLLPGLGRSRENARRVKDASNQRQIAIAATAYADENAGWWPQGRREGGGDDYVWIRYQTWLLLRDKYGIVEEAAHCQSVGLQPWMFQFHSGTGSYLGFIYWARRDDVTVGQVYTTPKRIGGGKGERPTSQTLLNCFHFWSSPMSHPWGSVLPHVGTSSRSLPPGGPIDPAPEGMVVCFLDSSATWTPWDQLKSMNQVDVMWYSPR